MTKTNAVLVLLLAMLLVSCGGGGGGGPAWINPELAPVLDGDVTYRGTSAIKQVLQNPEDLVVRVVVTNPNPDETDIAIIRYCLKHDPDEDDPLSESEAESMLDPVPDELPGYIDVQSVDYVSSPQIITIDSFKGGLLSPNERYWISATFVSSTGVAGPVTRPQRFKVIYRYQLVDPPEPEISMLKTFQGKVYDHEEDPLPNAFVQYFHEGEFLEAEVTDDCGRYYFEVLVPNPEAEVCHVVCCEESPTETDYVLKAYHPYYTQEAVKYLLPEYVNYYVDLYFEANWWDHDQGYGGDI